jgi:MtrB/PioB family decaheme-associated outer membrane protein
MTSLGRSSAPFARRRTGGQPWRRSLVALAVLAAFGAAAPAFAQEPPAKDVEASVSAGIATVSGDRKDRSLFCQYNGLCDDSAYGLLDFGYSRLDRATGTWTEAFGSNLLLDTRELGASYRRQGRWGAYLNYDELVRRDPYTVNSAIAGFGTTRPSLNYITGGPGTGFNFDLETKRKTYAGGYERWLTPALQFTADISNQQKDGAKQYGVGFACPSALAFSCGGTTATAVGGAVLFVPEPVDSSHTQAEARLNYSGSNFFVSGGYYGSFYSNNASSMTPGIPGVLNNPLGQPLPLSSGLGAILGNTVALAPDNQAHQFDLIGNYAFNPTTRANFKVALGTYRQDQDFASAGLLGAPAGVSSLGARVDTTLLQFGLASRPMAKLNIAADWRMEDRDDKTPLARYVTEGTSTTTNQAYSSTRYRAKLQGTYELPYKLYATAGLDYEFIDRGTFTSTAAARGVSALRQETEETGYRLELRRQMTETLTGSLAYVHAKRDGSSWLRPNATQGVTPVDPATGLSPTAIFAPNLTDRTRDKIKVFGSWQATDALSLQVAIENGKDQYDTPTAYALRDTKMELYSLDASYAINDNWSANGYITNGRQKLNQARPAGYILAYDNDSSTLGAGVQGKIGEKFDLGGSIAWIEDKSTYAQTLDPGAGLSSAALLAATGGLPEIVFKRTEFRLFGRYALSERSRIRLDAIFQRNNYNDWQYGYNGVPFVYGDNTILTQQEAQNVTFFGVTYTYMFR